MIYSKTSVMSSSSRADRSVAFYSYNESDSELLCATFIPLSGCARSGLLACVVDADEVCVFLDDEADWRSRGGIYRSTICMDGHIAARIEEQEIREARRSAHLAKMPPQRSNAASLSRSPSVSARAAESVSLPPIGRSLRGMDASRPEMRRKTKPTRLPPITAR